jgi:hypothetical protein
VLSFLLMCFLWHSFTGVACLWSVKGVGASVLGGGKSKNKPFCFTSCGFAYTCLLLPVGVFFFFFYPSSSCSFLLWFLVLWPEMSITLMFFQSSHHSYSSWLKTVRGPEHSYLVTIGIFYLWITNAYVSVFPLCQLEPAAHGIRGFVICGKDHTFREYPIMWQGASAMLYKSCVFFLTCFATHFFFLENVVMWFSQYMFPYMQWRALLVTCYGHAGCLHLLSVDGEKKNSCDVMQHVWHLLTSTVGKGWSVG